MASEENTQGQVPAPPVQRKGKKLASRSKVYQHFTPNDRETRWSCNYCGEEVGADTNKHGTTNLWKHRKKCKGRGGHGDPTSSRASRGRPETDGLRDKIASSSADLARMIALRGYDASFVEDSYFRSFVQSLDPGFEVPSRVAIEEMCDEIFEDARRELKSKLRRAPGRVSLALGKAKTIEAGEVMYIACHFIDDQWNLHKFVLDAFLVEGAKRDYTVGPVLGVHVFDDSNPEDDILHVIFELDDRLSMVAYDITDHDFPPELKDWIGLDCTTTTYVDTVLHSIARCLLPDISEFTVPMFWEMKNLMLTRQERLQLLSKLDLDLELAFDKSWCATYSSLQVLRKRGFTDQFAGAKLLSVQLLCKIWEQVYRGIQTISASTSPTSNLCLAELLKLKEILHSELARVSGYDADVQEQYNYCFEGKEAVDFLREASDILDKAIQDSYLIWSVPLALDPRYKLRYIEFSFGRALGSEAAKYVAEVTNKINKLYEDYIEDYGTSTDADHSDGANATVATTRADPLEQAWNEHCLSQDFMVTRVNSSYLEIQTELDRYLQDRNEHSTKDFDILKWWKAHSSEYPMVARMARDALAMPTCSKLSSNQLAQVRSILRGYSKKPYGDRTLSSSLSSSGGDMVQ